MISLTLMAFVFALGIKSPPTPVSTDSIKPAHTPMSGGVEGAWTVEAANAATLVAADSIQQWLSLRGYASRVVGDRAPFRVRIGHFPSMRVALLVARRLLRPGLTPFVTEGRR